MSSPDEYAARTAKKRKVQRACDSCRSKKTKCDGVYMPNNRCSNCTSRRIECTYVQANESGYPRSYVESLEHRLQRMEKLVSKLHAEKDVPEALDGLELRPDNDASERACASGSRINATPITPPPNIRLPTHRTLETRLCSDEEDGEFSEELTEGMQNLSVGSRPFRYHGKSSGLVFMRSAMAKVRDEHAEPSPTPKEDGQSPWLKAFVEDDFLLFDEHSFPPRDLMNVLVELYFRHVNCYQPLLHEPTFKASIEAGQHLRDGGFGATVLLVCANGSRFTRDPRVLLDGSHDPRSAGWKWFSLVDKARRLSFAPAKLHDLQVYVLVALFLQGTTWPHLTWAVLGAGIRAAVDTGAHRKKMYSPTPTVEEELWRRAFWILVIQEWALGYGLGRPCSIRDEDLDLALPIECDDEYWLTPEGEPLFKQPPGKPSKLSGFVYWLRLARLLNFTTRTIHAAKNAQTQRDHSDEQWEQRIVVELDSALNRWAESLPSHLRWDSEKEDELFLAQAATLKASYYNFQVFMHQPFTPSSSRPHPSLSSAICTNAARSSIQVLDVVYKRTGSLYYANMGTLHPAGTVLMVNILGLKRSGRATNIEPDLELVRKAIQMLRSLRYEMHVAEPLAEVLNEMMTAINKPLPDDVAHTPANAQSTATPKESLRKRPSSPVALSIEGPSRERHPQSPDTSQQPAAGDVPNTGPGLTFSPIASAHPDAMLHIPPDLDFLLSHPSPLVLHSDVLAPAAQSLTQGHGESHFDCMPVVGFGPEPFGYSLNESMSLLSSIPQVGTEHDAQVHHHFAHMGMPSGSGRADGGIPDSAALTDDGQAFRSNFLSGVGSESWSELEYFANLNTNTGAGT